ncbi:hypothetical protein GCM10027598_07220 [Amycolatopsis oliviviridis]|uniref:Uncharacterized protein n=1 Tax=Amycolatopsis oliviviridis TaxID=1471590 RepID=A0ABQ3LWZ8_9PSEU|nr:hypothetical protein [Amycolatopsis oliviviridis]GHH20585.1 hypothetical protein GCM10017790_40620 [Amycolatopsis oliviviridis]
MAQSPKVPATPQAAFGASAPALAPVAGQIRDTKTDAKKGTVKVTEDAAKKLVDALLKARHELNALIKDSTEFKAPLKLGDNFVGHTMSERFQGAATEGTEAAVPVLKDFAVVLKDLQLTVMAARKMYVAADEEGQEELERVARRFDMQDIVEHERKDEH